MMRASVLSTTNQYTETHGSTCTCSSCVSNKLRNTVTQISPKSLSTRGFCTHAEEEGEQREVEEGATIGAHQMQFTKNHNDNKGIFVDQKDIEHAEWFVEDLKLLHLEKEIDQLLYGEMVKDRLLAV